MYHTLNHSLTSADKKVIFSEGDAADKTFPSETFLKPCECRDHTQLGEHTAQVQHDKKQEAQCLVQDISHTVRCTDLAQQEMFEFHTKTCNDILHSWFQSKNSMIHYILWFEIKARILQALFWREMAATYIEISTSIWKFQVKYRRDLWMFTRYPIRDTGRSHEKVIVHQRQVN